MKQSSAYGKNHKGQVLITLLMFVLIAMTVIATAITTAIASARAASTEEQGVDAYYVAEAGAENALMRLLRNPSYSGETLAVGSNTAVVTVSGSTITSTGQVKNLVRTIQVVTSYNNNQLSIISWREVP